MIKKLKNNGVILLLVGSFFIAILLVCGTWVLPIYSFSEALSPAKYVSLVVLKVSYGKNPGEFGFAANPPYYDAPRSFVIDGEGNIFIEDSGNYRIQKFDKDGKFLLSVGKRGEAKGEFGPLIKQIDVDKEGNVYALDHWNYRIQKFDKDGKYMLDFKTAGADPKTHSQIQSLKITPSGVIFASDIKKGIQTFDLSGKHIDVPTPPREKGEISRIEDRQGNIYRIFRSSQGQFKQTLKKIVMTESKGQIQTQELKSFTLDLEKDSPIVNPPQEYLGFDNYGNLYILFAGKYIPKESFPAEVDCVVKKFDPNGNVVAKIDLGKWEWLNGGGRRFLVTGDGTIYQMNQLLDGIEIIKYYQERN